ncbi:transcriptional regulator, TetR family [Bosea sp. OK403]|uniref:TetR/AcrR family transcriptional regulator n=1 Tax=Bosea sp. OK403 TaxID=1855286 RepID=UPI0008ED6351|nr:TetR/AcrR family transcriptional regulator [Bosea sp. OK403]SFI05697.1 transcriptional regulator, TetR family [Bosea sp. OK403]
MAGRIRSNDPEGVRRRILDAAFEAFQGHGYHATSMHDLLRLAGLSGGALHHHFPTKKALALAVLRERVAEAVAKTWIEPVRAAASARAGVAEVLAAIGSELDRRGAVRGCPLNNMASELALADPDFRAAAADLFAGWRDAIAAKLREDNAPGDPQPLARVVIAAYSGAMAQAKAEQDSQALTACAKALAQLLPSPRHDSTMIEAVPAPGQIRRRAPISRDLNEGAQTELALDVPASRLTIEQP